MQNGGYTEGLTSREVEPVSRAVESTTETRRLQEILPVDYLQISEEEKVGLFNACALVGEDQKY